ncbi:ABC transporter permease [Haloquadratum walsbyi]|jgi:ABC-type dipeptide/oligopeptide/nickel transport systems, permease components|uniref:ABC-type dipeptide/oligopeptide/nickel transport system, permease component n=1 Tax=Haloquadratum walsbyi J07HQW2 TaxID=1238425 RepID=U1NGB0_9EURY|nr:ABC transporter permease [Haloquadratum walsbyi]ERG96160.1 MAG: ABC-type dipeptide/oligopeptide/nickel transport system, permease component [Haloquadratum walsbyi J07HQW2]
MGADHDNYSRDGKDTFLNIRFDRLRETISSDRKALFGLITVIGFILAAVFAPELAPFDPMAQEYAIMQSPSLTSAHPFGTDSFGRDLLSRIMFGARISLGVSLGAVSIAAIIGVTLGLVAGYYGGLVDDILMRFIDVLWAFPWLLVAIMLVAIFGQGVWNVIIAVAFAYIDDFARIIRGEVLSIREEEFVMAAKNIGVDDLHIMIDEVLPNAVAPLIVQFTVLVARAMLAESTLSFLGIGVKPTTPTWGALLGQGRGLIGQAWWISIIPGIAIVITVLGINLFGDALRDTFDVRQGGGSP